MRTLRVLLAVHAVDVDVDVVAVGTVAVETVAVDTVVEGVVGVAAAYEEAAWSGVVAVGAVDRDDVEAAVDEAWSALVLVDSWMEDSWHY